MKKSHDYISGSHRSIQIRAGALSKPEIESLGGPSTSGIPIALSAGQAPRLFVSRSANTVTISWPAEVTGCTLESTAALPTTAWTAVPGVVNNSVTVQATDAAQFYRLRR